MKNGTTEPVTIFLKDVFSSFQVESAEEVTLTGNELLSEATRFQWKTADGVSGGGYESSFNAEQLSVVMKPMEIRTLILTVKDKN